MASARLASVRWAARHSRGGARGPLAEILVRAKQLAHDDGRLWDTEDIKDAPSERSRFVDDTLRADYLNRALELLRYDKI